MAVFFIYKLSGMGFDMFLYICSLKKMVMEVYEKIKELRLRAGYTTRQLEERSGVPQSAISLIERGKKPNVSFATIEKLVNALGYEINLTPKL